MESKGSFTGRKRNRKTRSSVLWADRVARVFISIGGIGTILAVLGVMAFLVWVVIPLFLPARVQNVEAFDRRGQESILHLGVDEYKALAWVLKPSGTIEVFRLDTGEVRDEIPLFSEGQLNTASFLIQGDLAAFGLVDGTVQMAEVGFSTEFLNSEDLPEAIRRQVEANPGVPISFKKGVVELTPTGQYRVQQLNAELGDSIRVSHGPVRLLEHVMRSSGPLVIALAEQGVSAEQGVPPESASEPAEGASAVAEGDSAAAPEAAVESAEAAEPVLAADTASPAPAGAETLRLVAISGNEISNFLTGETALEFDAPFDLPFAPAPERGVPSHLAVNGSGSDIFIAWQDGEVLRLRRSDTEEPFIAESGNLLNAGGTLETLKFTLGSTTLIWGDSEGIVLGGFTVPREGFELAGLRDVERHDQANDVFATTKRLSSSGAASTALASSARSRLLWTGFADGEIRLYNVTNASQLRSFALPKTASGSAEPVLALAMAPKEDGVVAVTPSQIFRADIDPRHPEASIAGLFRPVWYEGYSAPQHTWQSSSGTDDFEMKLGLWPLIFGTLKATLYSVLFGAPLALLAAIFTSEFLPTRVKGVVKPSIELMASLPSVVLGFLAALVFAPFVERAIAASLAVFVGAPLAFLLGAYLWQLLPVRLAVRYASWRFGFMVLALPIGFLAAFGLGTIGENLLFSGDFRSWLSFAKNGDARFASPIGGWMILLLPLSAFIVALTLGRLIAPVMRRKASWDRRQFALADLAKFVLAFAATLILAYLAAALLGSFGFDPRGGVLDTYVQRNALIVGFVMGFAIIPIIYTISEDALQAVPEHLRSASLGAGATQWQTATRIIIPTAMSGLFSALMVGLGRAVGETMIVLMAAGNTPVLEWNIFNGFRTLSANIAVELPEAVKDSTHYRTLFLAALALFVMTFIINTVAEIIRLRFRKRAYQL
ncbi:MAG: ABC transporter permease subunit [Acidobacteriota bacterium]